MRFLWLSALKDLRRYRRDAAALALWFVLPLVIVGMIGAVFARDTQLQGLLLIADEDGGVAGTFLRESISRGPLGGMLAIQQVGRGEGRRRIDRGDGSALLIISKGYDQAVIHDEPAHWILITNPELSIMPRMVREVASANVDAAYNLQRIAGAQLRAFGDAPPSRRSVTDLMQGAGRTALGVATYLEPSRIVLKTRAVGDASARRPSVAEILFPGIVLLVILMVSAGMSLEIWKEQGAGAVRRVAGSPASLGAFLGGKLAATTVVLLLAILVTFGAARAIFQIPMRACLLAIAWSVCSAVAVYCGLLIAQLWLGSERSATTVSGMILVPLAMLGGSFFPLESMPESFAHFARMTPNGWMMVTLHSILTRPVAPGELAREFLLLLGAVATLFVLAWQSVARRLAR